ncbi:MAG: hypothetical protein D6705_18280 [Deltaproteobacteria bacterium]|nr:MAG: hypothetical protein D6705_18280 [Deltaproteobacteria bacterium]
MSDEDRKDDASAAEPADEEMVADANLAEGELDLEGASEEDAKAMKEAAAQVELVVLPVACINEGKGAPLGMGIQRWWAQELAARGGKAAAPVFTAMADQGERKVPALMVFREPWSDERAHEGITRFPNAKYGLAVDLHVESDRVEYKARLVEVREDGIETLRTYPFDGKAEDLPAALFDTLSKLAERFGVELGVEDWKASFGTENPQAVVSFLVGLGNLSALQGRCVPTTADQLLSPLVDAINRDAAMQPAMDALHAMVDILVQSAPDQSAIPLSLQALNVAAQRRKNDPGAYHHLALLFRRLGDLSSAVQAYNQAFNLAPTHPAIAAQFIDTLRTAGDKDNALKVAQFAVEQGNEDPTVMALLGNLMIEHDQFDEAEPFLRRAVEEGKVPMAYGDLANVLWDRSSGNSDQDREDREEAMNLLRTAVREGHLATTTMDMLLDLYEEDGIEEAMALILEAAEKYPNSATVQRYAATLYLEGDAPEKARPFLEKMLSAERRTLDDDAFARRGLLQLDVEDFEDRYDQAIEDVRSGDAAAQERAAKFLREIIAKDDKFWQPHLMLALAVRGTEGDDAALAHLMDAVRLRPNDAEIRNLIAAILRKQGRAKEAVDHLRAVVALKPREVEPVVNLAACMRDANMFEEARQVCQAALQMMPNHPDFTRILQSLPPPKQQA